MSGHSLDHLRRAILEYNSTLGQAAVKEIVERGADPLEAFEVLAAAMKEVGDGFERNELWLPDLMAAASIMKAIMPIIEHALEKSQIERSSRGIVVIGTVRGDIYDIGKNMVATLLAADNFMVYDLGVDLPPERFIESVKEHRADLLAISALLTTTAQEMKRVIEDLRDSEYRDKVKVMVGGGPITEAFAHSIGADGYDPTAPGAVKLARQLMET